jgi:hypothetical protein
MAKSLTDFEFFNRVSERGSSITPSSVIFFRGTSQYG